MNPLPRICLSIRQPWATSIVHFGKDVENRGWDGVYLRSQLLTLRRNGNRFLIHASSSIMPAEIASWKEFVQARDVVPTQEQAAACGATKYKDLPRGGIVGVATFVEWVTSHPSRWFMGPGALVLKDVQPIPFTPCKGMLGFFSLPPDIDLKAA